MTNAHQSLLEFLQTQSAYVPNDDLMHMFVPLMKQVLNLHQQRKVASLHPSAVIFGEDGRLCLKHIDGSNIKTNHLGINQIQRINDSALQVVGNLSVTHHGGYETDIEDLNIADKESVQEHDKSLTKPLYFVDYQSWESRLDHHDPLSDIFGLGLLLVSAACGLDLSDKEELKTFTLNRQNLFRLNPHLHPAIATLIEGMTQLNRHERESDLSMLTQRLECYRDEQGRFNAQHVIDNIDALPDRRSAILSHLRDRLFDLSRRNKLIHFKPTQASVNLTIASVPLVMRIESIRKEQLCTWGNSFEKGILSCQSKNLGAWLRFEDQSYLPSSINRLMQQSRKDKAEYGFSSLRLVIAFFNWYNLKDAPEDKISSPLLWLNVDLKKKKGVKDQFVITCLDTNAEFNPALRHYLKQLYDINLPYSIDLNEHSIKEVHQSLAEQIAQSEPNVKLAISEQPSIRLIHEKAVKKMHAFNKRRGKRSVNSKDLANYNYDKNDYRPLGKAIFEKYIESQPLPQASAVGQVHQSKPDFMSAPSNQTSAQTYVLDKGNTGKYNWEIDLAQVTLANFNYKKMSLVRDYSDLIENSMSESSLDKLFSIHARQQKSIKPKSIDIQEQFNVVASDITQDQAVALAREQQSFIIQGPPGTGKSQTITNLIADFAAQNKRVLFVCEKRAALDVVYNRLKQAGLEKLACIIHDIQEDKKPFIQDLKSVYEGWFEAPSEIEAKKTKREQILNVLQQDFSQIDQLGKLLSTVDEKHALCIQALVRLKLQCEVLVDDYDTSTRQQLPNMQQWQNTLTLAKRIELTLKQQLDYDCIADTPFAQLSQAAVEENPEVEQQNNTYVRIKSRIEKTDDLSDKLQASFDSFCELLGEDYTLNSALHLSQLANKTVNTGLIDNLDLFEPNSELSIQVKQALHSLELQQQKISVAQNAAKLWREPLSRQDTNTALAIAQSKENTIFRWFSRDWHALKGTVTRAYDFSQHAVKPKISAVIEQLVSLHKEQDQAARLETQLSTTLGKAPVNDLFALKLELEALFNKHASLKSVFTSANRDILKSLANAFDDLQHYEKQVASLLCSYQHDKQQIKCDDIQQSIRDMRESLDELTVILPLLQASFSCEKPCGFVLRNIKATADLMHSLVVDEALQQVLRETPEFANFDVSKLAKLSKRSAAAKHFLLEENANVLVSQRHQLFTEHLRHSNLSVTGMDEQQRAFKKHYATGRREVEHEFGKTLRYKSIRDMASDESGAVVSDLKPIWLMSPLSVSDTLPLEADLFDVVIFDEASQIPIEDAIPALCRAPQLIVVGDEMQLPPTSFFSSSANEDAFELEVQEDGESMRVLLDADSLLSQAARHLPATLLAWHYRSRSESLISFSNAAFYDSQLVTIPDQKPITHHMQPKLNGSENNVDAELELSLQSIIQKPISFHFIEEGIYQDRCNLAEAQQIALLVRSLLMSKHGDSIGIVAFSEAQQSCIDDALENLAEQDAEFSLLLEEEYQREDDDQFNGLFIKNLENVQGDERDIIILSICYAKGPKGKMLMNFGPINQRGGEKRLNVIFSRAKKHMAVVSSIFADAITNTHNDGAFALKTFLAFAQAHSDGNVGHARQALSNINPKALEVFSAKASDDPLREQIAKCLQDKGYLVDQYVGSASFRCDLAIKDSETLEYRLGILLDHSLASQSTSEIFERYVFKPNILRAFSWKVIDVFSSAWIHSPHQVIAAIEHELNCDDTSVTIDKDELFSDLALQDFTPATILDSEEETNDSPEISTMSEPDEFQCFE